MKHYICTNFYTCYCVTIIIIYERTIVIQKSIPNTSVSLHVKSRTLLWLWACLLLLLLISKKSKKYMFFCLYAFFIGLYWPVPWDVTVDSSVISPEPEPGTQSSSSQTGFPPVWIGFGVFTIGGFVGGT